MSRFRKIIRNVIILIILSLVFFRVSWLFFSPLSAHKHSERSLHYGPSKIVHIENLGGSKYILGDYGKWVSCDVVNRMLYFFWRFGSPSIAIRNPNQKVEIYSLGATGKYHTIFGGINDIKIKKIEIALANGKMISKTKFYDNLFLLTWKDTNRTNVFYKAVKGYDSNGIMIYEANQ